MTDEEVAKLKEWCADGIRQASTQAKNLPKGREAACVLTKLDEARMWLGEVPGTDPAGKKF